MCGNALVGRCGSECTVPLRLRSQPLQGPEKTSESDGRAPITTTVEMFRGDTWGSTYFFIDLDYNAGMKGAYWEISREICFWQESKLGWLSAHVEYDGGLSDAAGSFNNAWLVGPTYSGHSKDFTKTWSVSVMYKYIPKTYDTAGKSRRATSS